MAAAELGHVTRPLDLIADAVRGTGDHVAVTGATGWLGSVALDLLYRAFGDDAPGHVTAYASRRREMVVADGRKLDALPLSELGSQDPAPTTLLHFAFLTRDKVAALGIDAYTSQNVAITTTVLDAIAKHRPEHVVVTSSGVVSAATGQDAADLRADPYRALKHLDELAFRTATRDVGGVCVIPRVFSVAGSRMTKPELYALGSMVQMAAAGGPIDVRAQGAVYRAYCGADEVVALALWAAYAGRDIVFDSGGTVVEMGELAEVVAHAHGLNPDVVRRTWDPAVPAERYVGDGRLMESLAAEAGLPLRSLADLVGETSAWLTAPRPPERAR